LELDENIHQNKAIYIVNNLLRESIHISGPHQFRLHTFRSSCNQNRWHTDIKGIALDCSYM